jgi:hypothetical protein
MDLWDQDFYAALVDDTEAEALGKPVTSWVPNDKTWARAYKARAFSVWLSTHTQEAPWNDHPHYFVKFDKMNKEIKHSIQVPPHVA